MDDLYKTFSLQNKQYTWAMPAPYTAKLQIWILKTLRECKWKIGSPKMHWISFEVYKYLNGLSPDNMNTIFKLRQNTYNLRNFHIFESQIPRTKKFGLDSITYRASQLWENVSEEIRNTASLLIFKESIKDSPLISCSCHCCKTSIHHLGYI